MFDKALENNITKTLSVLAAHPNGMGGRELQKGAAMKTAYYVPTRKACLAQKLMECSSGGPRNTKRYSISDRGLAYLSKQDYLSYTADHLKFDFGSESDFTVEFGIKGGFDTVQRFLIPRSLVEEHEATLAKILRGIVRSTSRSIPTHLRPLEFDLNIHVRAPSINQNLLDAYFFLQEIGQYLNAVKLHYLYERMEPVASLLDAVIAFKTGKQLLPDEEKLLKDHLITEYFLRSPEAMMELFLVANHFHSLGYNQTNAHEKYPWIRSLERPFVSLQQFANAKWRTVEREKRERILNGVFRLLYYSFEQAERELGVSHESLSRLHQTKDWNEMTHLLDKLQSHERRALDRSFPPYFSSFKYITCDGKTVDLSETVQKSDEFKRLQSIRNDEVRAWIRRMLGRFEYCSSETLEQVPRDVNNLVATFRRLQITAEDGWNDPKFCREELAGAVAQTVGWVYSDRFQKMFEPVKDIDTLDGKTFGEGHWLSTVPWAVFGIIPPGSPRSASGLPSDWYPIDDKGFLFTEAGTDHRGIDGLMHMHRACSYDRLSALKELFERHIVGDKSWPLLWKIFKECREGNRHPRLMESWGRDSAFAWYWTPESRGLEKYPEDWGSQGLVQKLLEKLSKSKPETLRPLIIKACEAYEMRRANGWGHKASVKDAISEACKSCGVKWRPDGDLGHLRRSTPPPEHNYTDPEAKS